MLTDETQHGYKTKKSTIDIIYHAKRNFIKNKINGPILIDLPKAFDGVDRGKLWEILYGKGLPISFI